MNKILKIKDIMSANVVSFSVDTLVDEIVSTMQKKKISSIIIVDGKKPLGIITERDIVKASLSPEHILQMNVTELMSSPVITMPSYADYRDAYMQMNEQKIRHIVVTDNEGELVGILSESNFLNHLSPDQLLAIKEIPMVMTKSVFTCKPTDSLRSVLEQIVDKKIGGIVVEENNKAVGIISERDALKFIQESKEFLDQAVSTCMSTPVSTIHKRQTVLNAQTMMDSLGIRRLVVVDDNETIAGVVSRHDLIKHIPEYYVEILRDMINLQKSLVTDTQAKLDEKIIFQNAVKSLPHTIVLMTQSEGIIEFVNIKEKAFCNIPKINIGDNINDLESSFFELLKNKTWKDKVVKGETVHKIVKVTNQTSNSCYLHTSISAIYDEEKNFKGYLYIARDISQEQTLELQLKRLNKQLQEAYHIANIGNWELDANTLNAFWSDEICDIVGMEKGTVGGPELLKTLVKEKDFERIESSLISALQTGSEHEIIYEVFPKNSNKSHWVECRARRELNEDGSPRCLIGTLQDITQRIEAQTTARENEDSMILALESAGHGVWDFNAKENTQNLSPQYKSMLGYDNHEIENTFEAFLNLLHPDDLSQVQSTIESFIMNKHYKGDKFHHTFRMKTKDGTYRWILSNANVISTDKDGTLVRIIGTHTDITEQKQIEEELRLFKRSVESAKDGITITRADNDQEAIYVNPAFEKLTGYASDEILGKNLRLLNEKNREQPEIDLLHNAIENNKSIEVALKNYRKDGSEFISQLSIDPIFDETNTATHFVGFQKDITQRIETEKALAREKERYEKAERIAKLGSWEQDLVKDTLKWSDEVYRIFEADKSKEVTFDDFIQRVHPEDAQSVYEAFYTSVKEHKNYHIVHRLLFADGRIKYVSEDAQHFYDSSNKHIYSVGTVQDITAQQEAELEFQKAHSLLTKLSDTIPAMIYQYQLYPDGSSRFPYASVGIEDIYEVTPKQVIEDAQCVFDVVYPDDLAMVVDSITKSAETMQLWNLDYRVTLPKKGLRWLRGTAKPQKLEDGAILWHGYIQDITKEKNNFNILRENERRLRQSATVFENTTEGVMITDTNSIILDVNEAFCKITGRERNEVLGKPASILQSGRHNKKFYNEMWKSISNGGSWRGEIWNRRKNGEIYPQWLNISSVKSDSGTVESYIAVFSDITSLKETEAQLDFLAHHDHLTELPNRVLLNARLKHTLSTAKRDNSMTAVMFMDIDNFKNINDSYGHTFGDELLMAVSHRLKSIMREDDTFARIGGDEFVVVMSHFKTLEQITHISQKIMEQFEEIFTVEEKEFWISVSIGISIAPDDGNSSEILIKNADTAMYEAKGDGKNTFKFYNDKMSASSFERVIFENALKAGITNQEFEVYYQPQEDLQNNSIIGFEALIRWNHPSLGLVPPDKFISIAEETKMILDIGSFVLEQSCKDIKQWHDEGLCKGRIAVNVSGIQLEHSEFAEILKYNLKKYDVDPSMIEIEVTESMVMKNPQRWISVLEEIHRIGVSISIDDFGTGYSSLSYLRRMPVDTLKIDQSFIQDIPEEKDACAIVDAIINMADSLGINTLAEGIETSNQREYLVKKSCKHGQGYLLSKPMNGKDTYNWLKARHLKK